MFITLLLCLLFLVSPSPVSAGGGNYAFHEVRSGIAGRQSAQLVVTVFENGQNVVNEEFRIHNHNEAAPEKRCEPRDIKTDQNGEFVITCSNPNPDAIMIHVEPLSRRSIGDSANHYIFFASAPAQTPVPSPSPTFSPRPRPKSTPTPLPELPEATLSAQLRPSPLPEVPLASPVLSVQAPQIPENLKSFFPVLLLIVSGVDGLFFLLLLQYGPLRALSLEQKQVLLTVLVSVSIGGVVMILVLSHWLYAPVSSVMPAPTATPTPTPIATPPPTPTPTPTQKPKPKPSVTPTAMVGSPTPAATITRYSLVPGNSRVVVRSDLQGIGGEAYVLLQDQNGVTIPNQSDIDYKWEVANGTLINYDLGRSQTAKCYPLPDVIQQPCPNFSALLTAHGNGETTITVIASKRGGGELSRTTFTVVAESAPAR